MSDAPTVRKNMSDGTRRFVIHTGKLDGALHASYICAYSTNATTNSTGEAQQRDLT